MPGNDSPSPTPVELFGLVAAASGNLIFELDAIAPAVVHVDVGNLVVGLAGIVVGDPAEVDLPVMVAGRAGVVGDKWRPALRANIARPPAAPASGKTSRKIAKKAAHVRWRKILRKFGSWRSDEWSRVQVSILFLRCVAKPTSSGMIRPAAAFPCRGSAPVPGLRYLAGLRYLIVMPIDDLQQAAQKIAGFLNSLNKLGGLRLKYRISATDGAHEAEGAERARSRQISVELAGPDVPLVIQHNGELLRAIETLAAQMLRLDHHEHDMVSFDAANFKALRAEELRLSAETAADKVRQTGTALQLSAHEQP